MIMDSPSDLRTPIPEGRGGLEDMAMSPFPAPLPPRSPWKKLRRDFESGIAPYDVNWTSGELFRFDQISSDKGESSSILGEGGRLSLGMLDLSGASDGNFIGSDLSTEERFESGNVSPNGHHAAQIDTLDSSNSPSPNRRHRHVVLSSPDSRRGKKHLEQKSSPGSSLDTSSGSGNNSSMLSTMQTANAIRRFRPPSPSHSDSPLHPQRLFIPGVHDAENSKPAGSDVVNAVNNTWQVPTSSTRRQSAPVPDTSTHRGQMMQDVAGNRLRQNPFSSRYSPYTEATPFTSSPLTLRSFLNDFCDFKEIGSGCFGKVYSCTRKIDLCKYAVKEIREFKNERERERLLREIYALSTQGDNVHVVRYFNAWEQDNKLYIQTELCQGTVAHVRQKNGPLHEEYLKDFLVQVATGLAYMHSHKIAHLDVKPENIYTTERGMFKLGDLGLACSADLRTHDEEGDKRYLSREMLQHSESCDLFKADIFALGVSVVELASVTPLPTEGSDYHRIRDGKVDFPPSLSPPFQALIQSLLDPNPMNRPSASDIVRHPLLFGLIRNESVACLRVIPRCEQRDLGNLMELGLESKSVVKLHQRALKAEKEVQRLQASLTLVQQELQLLKRLKSPAAAAGADKNVEPETAG
ncbi:hypothetical protein GUITHDRAFT_105104 [Guillardia theta CCMP2712]|uniref:Protein kinase domain-containing protein n=1 Tax=Guillardia theta (strain CCMP2712) TaxID=905079 RepID=L1JKG7_GUITC|nr:hypothetical protein GUITHDRAFT_105104 [Guillardia theta CCMP2712]EKX49023.1 hypothetical protein GUITHDRAFT_105104 [Guillardia theta CCMP2712]|eukprot:XP_005836003.1 hypothetical protein GUITHDRAFT_105104 [Guillardia theta CCMP2712]